MTWVNVYTPEADEDNYWTVINETSITGHRCLSLQMSEFSANLFAEAMNEVYNQIKKDFEAGHFGERKE